VPVTTGLAGAAALAPLVAASAARWVRPKGGRTSERDLARCGGLLV